MKFRRSAFEILTSHRDAWIILCGLLFAFLTFSVVLSYPPSESVTRIFYIFNLQTGVLLVIFLGLVFSRKGVGWEASSLILVIVLFGLPLIYKWQTAKFDGVMFGGLLPWSDASRYYISAQRLMTGSDLNEIASWRPIFAGSLTILLFITGNNLQISLAVLAALNGTATFLAAREIQKKVHSAFVAALFVTICFWYYCAIAGTVMTENLGLCFGSLSLAFLVQGAEQRNLKRIGFGLFLLTIALSIRAGAFFILPALLLWFVMLYKEDFGWKGFLIVSMAILIAMTSNVIFKKVIGNPQGILFSNYSYTLYGLASGNAGWKQVLIDFPDVKNDEIFGLAIAKIKKKPALFGLGMARAFQDYFSMGNGGFSFLRLIGDKNVGNRLLWIFTWMGLATALFTYKRPASSMVMLAFIGVLASTILVPPNDADSMRVYAATIPLTAYLASLGMVLPETLLKKIGLFSNPAVAEWKTDHLLFPLSAVLLFFCLVLPLVIKGVRNPPKADDSLACSPNEVEILFSMSKGSSIRLASDHAIRESYIPSIQVTPFRDSTQAGPSFYPFLTHELVTLEPGYAITVGGYRTVPSQDSDPIQIGYLITNGQIPKPGFHPICVTPAKDENLRDRFFYYFNHGYEASQDLSLIQKYPHITNAIRFFYGLGLLAILLGLIDLWSLTPTRQIFLFGNVVLIVIGILVNLHSTAIYPLSWERRPLQAENAIYVEGYSYKIDLGMNWMDRRSLRNSPAVVYENGIPLRHPNNSLFNIKERGKGRFSVQDGYLFLSASDNSNPQTNGRTYEIYWPTPIPSFYRYGFCMSLLIGVFFLVRFSHKRHPVENPS